MRSIDFVLPWVDGSDPVWQEQKASYESEIRCKQENDHGEMRYRDTKTLKYVLRSIEQNCPWYRKIIIITEGHTPSWINPDHPKIQFVTHRELYLHQEHLPTFNSTSIEMNLCNLKDVSEKFVYLNDDCIIWNRLEPERFFIDELPVDFLIHGWIPRNRFYQMLRDNSTWVKSMNNIIKLINAKFSPSELYRRGKEYLFHPTYGAMGKVRNFFLLYLWRRYFFFCHWHHPQPYRMKTIKEVYSQFKESMMICSKNRFRSDNDLSQYLYRYYRLAKGDFFPYFHNDGYYLHIRSHHSLKEDLDAIEKENPNFITVYDNYDSNEEEKVLTLLTDILEKRFPKKAGFEL